MIDDEERRKVKKRVTEEEIKRNSAVERKRKSRGSFTFLGGGSGRECRGYSVYMDKSVRSSIQGHIHTGD